MGVCVYSSIWPAEANMGRTDKREGTHKDEGDKVRACAHLDHRLVREDVVREVDLLDVGVEGEEVKRWGLLWGARPCHCALSVC